MNAGDVDDIYPLTPTQEGLLFHTLLAPESGVYVIQQHGLLEGELDLAALSAAWDRVVERRAILRTSFEWDGLDRPLQIVHRRVHLPLSTEDRTAIPAEEQEARWRQRLAEDRRQGFDLHDAPLMRFLVVRLNERQYRFLWSHHHVLADGWSLPLLLQEVFTFYEASRQGLRLNLPDPRPFRDYIAWLERQDPKQAEAFWREQLSGFDEPVRIGIDRGGAADSANFRKVQRDLSPVRTKRLETFARQQQLTLNTLVQAAWAMLLGRYSGRQDVVFGMTVSGRAAPIPGIESMIGPFINTLPVRVKLPGDVAVRDWLTVFQQQAAAMRSYEYSSLVKVQRQSDVPAGTPLFEYLYLFENYPVDMSSAGALGGKVKLREVCLVDQTNYPLMLAVVPGAGLTFRVSYLRDRFDDGGVERMLDHLERLLDVFVAEPHRTLAAVDLLSSAERRQLLGEWNQRTPYPSDRCIHESFEEQAERRPEAIAVVSEGVSLTHGELNERANQVAHHLRMLGVGPESLVGIYLERNAEMVIGILGILKAGGAYVPLDPTYPAERLAFMLADSQARLVVTDSTMAARLELGEAQAVCLDDEMLRQQDRRNPERRNVAENVAYVIYTSGSTGRPKGCLVTHANVTRLFGATEEWYRFDETDVWTVFHSFAFDFSVWELWGALLYGGRLVVVPYRVSRSPEQFRRLLTEERVTVLNQTPSAFQPLMEADAHGEGPLWLKWVIFGGEALRPAKLAGGVRRHGDDGACDVPAVGGE